MMEEKMLEKVEGVVASVIYTNDENGYTVLRLDENDGSSSVVVGCIPMAAPGESLIAWGNWTHHASHGEQFKAEHAERTMPSGSDAIFAYLSSRVIKGIGPATAAALVSKFGDDTLNVLRNHPEQVAAMRGISEKKAKEICEAFRHQTGMRSLMEYLATAAIPSVFALRLYRYYGENALDMAQENPYILSSVQIGARFADADALALEQGIDEDAPERVAAAILYELRYNADNGHCFLPEDKLAWAVSQLIGIMPEQVGEGLQMLLDSGEIIREPVSNVTACYLAQLYSAETYVTDRLRNMSLCAMDPGRVKPSLVIEKMEAEQNIKFAPMQRKTLDVAANCQLTVITGGPGTGKTTSVRAVLALFDAMGLETFLAAPTGQAAKRLSYLTGRDASTIHRLLEASFSPETDSVTFHKKENDKLKCGALILDECSMIDISLMRAVLAATGSNCRLVLVGDADQLPSVGPGCVFRDIIRSGIADTIRLTDIFRQQEGSRIVTAAHDINSGVVPDLRLNKDGFFFMRRKDAEEAAKTVVSLCGDRLPRNMGLRPEDIQVLTPTKKGAAGTENLNKLLQEALNPADIKKNEFTFGGKIFREGDRVMQIRNDYDILWRTDTMESGSGIFNGDIGTIRSIDPASESMTIDFDGRLAEYAYEQAAELDHAWATTVHKSQGSEYKAVVLCCSQTPPQLMYRGLLYTAVSRASELLVVVGDDNIIASMVDNAHRAKRYSGLRIRLCHA